MSFLNRLYRQLPLRRLRPVLARGSAPRVPTGLLLAGVVTALACLLVLSALVAPDEPALVTPGAFLRIPLEALLGVVLVLLLPARARRVVAVLVGVVLGLLLILKIIDMGFFTVMDRPFDPVLDWSLFGAGLGFLTESIGRGGTIGVVVAAVVLAVAVVVLMPLAVLRLTRLVHRHRTVATRTVAVLGVAWVALALLGAQIVPGVPVASRSAASHAYDRVHQAYAGLQDRRTFAAESAVDAFRGTPDEELLTALRGKDVIVAFIESYGRSAVEDPQYAPGVGRVLGAGNRRLDAAGFAARSGFLTSPTVGGASWLAHTTLLTGLWVDNQERYHAIVETDRLTLNGAFRRAGWRTVGVMPGVTQDWPEGEFFGYDRIYTADDLAYQGPRFNWAPMPDQYTLSIFQRFERARPGHDPVMAEIPLVSSHAPWAPLPSLLDWEEIGDGSVFEEMVEDADSAEEVWRTQKRIRAAYRQAIEYTVGSLISYVEMFGDEDLVLIFVGDHQPTPLVTGEDASRDVPIAIVAGDPALLDRISGWGWQDGLRPGPQAPVWRMDEFRDRFLTAFGPSPLAGPP